VKNANIIMLVSMDYVSFVTRMNNYQEETLKELLKDVKVRCSVCHSKMIRVIDLYDDTLIGYSCEHCPHYNLLDNDPI